MEKLNREVFVNMLNKVVLTEYQKGLVAKWRIKASRERDLCTQHIELGNYFDAQDHANEATMWDNSADYLERTGKNPLNEEDING
jgi:hypothetical protein